MSVRTALSVAGPDRFIVAVLFVGGRLKVGRRGAGEASTV